MGLVPLPSPRPPSGPPTHVPEVFPLQRALVLLLVEQGHILGLQPSDGLGPIVLGVKMDLPDLGRGSSQLLSR